MQPHRHRQCSEASFSRYYASPKDEHRAATGAPCERLLSHVALRTAGRMQASGRAEDMQALLVDLRPAPDSLVAGQQQQQSNQPAAPPLTANAVLGRYVGAPLPGPMLARILPPGPTAMTGIQAGGQSSSIQIQPGGANVVRLSLSNKVFLKDHRKEKKKKSGLPSRNQSLCRVK
ncbi:hypothetical protein MTO96_020919 [Rhipicephalus appendiculatus]